MSFTGALVATTQVAPRSRKATSRGTASITVAVPNSPRPNDQQSEAARGAFTPELAQHLHWIAPLGNDGLSAEDAGSIREFAGGTTVRVDRSW